MKKGLFIAVEGTEGMGKSTAIKFIGQRLAAAQISFVLNREPGGTEISEAVRNVLLEHYQEIMAPTTELLLMFACRAQNIASVIKPALQKGTWVLSDRFTDASLAYQGYGRGMPLENINILAELVHENLYPDVVILLDAPVEIGFERLKRRLKKDRIESENLHFFESVRNGYLELAKQRPQQFRIIDAAKNLMEVQNQLAAVIDEIILAGTGN